MPAGTVYSTMEALLQSMACLCGVSQNDLVGHLDPHLLNRAAARLHVPDPPWSAQVARRTLAPLLMHLPAAVRLRAADGLKRLRSPSRRLAHLDPHDFAADRLVAEVASRLPVRLWGPDKRFCLALTHDVDTSIGYDFIPTLLDELAARGLTSSFFFLTHGDYRLDPGLLRQLARDGFEVGLHGATHDVSIGYRPRSYIRRWLERGCAALGGVPAGFRAPGLGVSRVLLAEVARAGFVYDSSYQTGSRLYHSVGYSFPYRLPGLPLVELPLWFQDAFLFRDANLSVAEALAWCEAAINQLRARCAAVVFLMHPDNMATRTDFMRRFLDLVAAWRDGDALVCPLGEVVRRFTANPEPSRAAP